MRLFSQDGIICIELDIRELGSVKTVVPREYT
jgi:hypothetical protein